MSYRTYGENEKKIVFADTDDIDNNGNKDNGDIENNKSNMVNDEYNNTSNSSNKYYIFTKEGKQILSIKEAVERLVLKGMCC